MNRPSNELYKNKGWLEQQYNHFRLTMKEIGEDRGVSGSTIRYFIIKFGIPMRRSGPPSKAHRATLFTRCPVWLRDQVKTHARRKRMCMSDVLQEALMEYLSNKL